MSKDIVLTGLRANSEFHIGNYLGAILPVIELQKRHAGEYQVNMFVPDLHSFTTPIDHGKLYQQIIHNLKIFVAAGLDINNPDTFIYRQSFVPAHSEMTWILDCFAGMGELSRMTQFKDKSKSEDILTRLRSQYGLAANEEDQLRREPLLRSIKERSANAVSAEDFGQLLVEALRLLDEETNKTNDFIESLLQDSRQSENASVGLFNYPVLMAADILLYGAKYVPVGEDQRQHLELTRDLGMRLNNKFGQDLFTVPEDWNAQLAFAQRDNGVRIRSLRNPEKKMSKSVSDPSGTIMLSDTPAEAAKKVMRAETDSFGEIRFNLAERPGISNLLQMLALLSGKPQSQINQEWEGQSRYGDLKKAVAEQVESFLQDLQTKLAQVDESELLAKLESDEAAMNIAANQTLLRAQKAVGLRA